MERHGTACGNGGNSRPAGRCKGHGRKRNEVGQRILSGATVPRQGSGGSPLTPIDLQSLIVLSNWRLSLCGGPLNIILQLQIYRHMVSQSPDGNLHF